jgi:hypothetical protein
MKNDAEKLKTELVLKLSESVQIIYGLINELENRISKLEKQAKKNKGVKK